MKTLNSDSDIRTMHPEDLNIDVRHNCLPCAKPSSHEEGEHAAREHSVTTENVRGRFNCPLEAKGVSFAHVADVLEW